MIGHTLGPYEITGALGAGGMGEVFRGRDTKLHREVAIKVLPAAVASDAERLARFEREAQLLAALNHSGIAAIHGLDQADGRMFLVMELVEGQDLAERLARGPLPVDEAVAAARQIAEALEEAHEKGIVHRDLKPANIKVTPDGRVKVLDFGLAKAYARTSDGARSSDVSDSPTLTHSGTEAGVILGTAAYMSPEQARGKVVDRRADIWAFGVVLYEMLTGRRLFAGETTSDILAAVLTREPDWSSLPAATPRAVRLLLHRCLERDVRLRLQAIGEARIVLSDPAALRETEAAPATAGPLRRALPWLLALAAAAVAAWSVRAPGRGAPATMPVTHLDVTYPRDIEPIPTVESGFNISPDGRLVSITGARNGARRLHVRSLSRDDSVEIADSLGVTGSSFSPDGASIALLGSLGRLLTVSLADQRRSEVARGADLAGGISWGKAGIAFARNAALWLLPAGGGPERRLTTLDPARREVLHANPRVLDRVVLFSSLSSDAGSERVEAVDVESGQRRTLVDRATTPLVSPTGHLLFARDGAVMAQAFDPATLALSGPVVTVFPSGVVANTSAGGLGIRVSESGDLLYLPAGYHVKRVESVARDGSALTLAFPAARYMNPRVSPDGRRVMVETASLRLDVLDLERQTISRLTSEAPGTFFSMWSRDGRHVIYRRYNTPTAFGADGDTEIPGAIANDYPSGAGPDPDSFFSTRIQPDSAGDIVLVSRTGAFAPRPLIATPTYEGGAQLSPDGRWLAYVTSESGVSEIHLRAYPALDRRWTVSAGVGIQPRWRHDSREIYYRDGEHLVAVPFDGSGSEPVIGKPVPLFRDEYDVGQGVTIANYDVLRDGRFVMLRRDAKGTGLRLVLNWGEELKRRVAESGAR